MIGAVSLVILLIFIPLWMKKIGPNRYYGYRTRYSLSHKNRWFHMNKFCAGVSIPLFAFLSIGELFFAEKQLVWIMLGGIIVILFLCFLEEGRQRILDKVLKRTLEKEGEGGAPPAKN